MYACVWYIHAVEYFVVLPKGWSTGSYYDMNETSMKLKREKPVTQHPTPNVPFTLNVQNRQIHRHGTHVKWLARMEHVGGEMGVTAIR